MKKIQVCTVGFDPSDKDWKQFRDAVNTFRKRWPKEFQYTFLPLSVSYVEGGTHIILCNSDKIAQTIIQDLCDLCNQKWPQYKVNVTDIK